MVQQTIIGWIFILCFLADGIGYVGRTEYKCDKCDKCDK